MYNTKTNYLSWKSGTGAVFMIALLLVPMFNRGGSLNMLMNYVILITMNIALVQSWNIMGGLAGLFSMGHAAFFGIGAYCLAITLRAVDSGALQVAHSSGIVLGVLLGLVVSLILAFIISAISTRLSGFFFTMSTIALLSAMVAAVGAWPRVTNGTLGIPIFRPPIDRAVFFYISIGLAVAYTLCFAFLRKARMGSMLVSIRDNIHLARSLGVRDLRYKVLSCVVSSLMASLVGAVYVYFVRSVAPSIFFASIASMVVMVGIIGGIGTVWGPVLGSSLILVDELVRTMLGSVYAPLVNVAFGIIMIVMVILKPEGLVSLRIKHSLALILKALKPVAKSPEEGV